MHSRQSLGFGKDPKAINPTIKVIDPTLEYTPPIFNELDAILNRDGDDED